MKIDLRLMSFWQDFLSFVTLKPLPLSEDWEKIESILVKNDRKAPVSLVELEFTPEKEKLRRYISARFMQEKITEITEMLMHFTSVSQREAPGFVFLQEEESTTTGDVSIIWNPEGGKFRHGLFLKLPQDFDECMALELRRVLNVLLAPLKTRPEVGFSLTYRLGAAHPKWRVPKAFKHLDY